MTIMTIIEGWGNVAHEYSNVDGGRGEGQKLDLHCLSELVLYAVRNRIVQIAEQVLEDPIGEQSGIVPSIGTQVVA